MLNLGDRIPDGNPFLAPTLRFCSCLRIAASHICQKIVFSVIKSSERNEDSYIGLADFFVSFFFSGKKS